MYILSDIGGSKTRIAVSQDLASFEEPIVYPTPQNYTDGIQQFIAEVQNLANGEPLKGLSIGVPGTLNRPHSKLIAAPNLPNWINKKLQRNLSSALSCPVHVENDAALVGLGEAVHGPGRDFDLVCYVTVSTGVGGAMIKHGRISETTYGFEPGQQIINITEDKNYQTLESLASGSGLVAARESSGISDEQYWEDAHDYLAIGLSNMFVHWSPEAVVIGGGNVNHDHINFEILEQKIKSIYRLPEHMPKILKAELKDFGGIYGGIEVLKNDR